MIKKEIADKQNALFSFAYPLQSYRIKRSTNRVDYETLIYFSNHFSVDLCLVRCTMGSLIIFLKTRTIHGLFVLWLVLFSVYCLP